ncbi:hypothetical protein IH601_04260, partial [Candidatus Bipolaricaulota bacterium]|nr:hypothetical protein [Candidatus Bipolaricaulota bacterium]
MRLGRDPIRRLMLVSLAVVLFVGLGYGVSWVDESLPWLRALVQLAQIGFLVLAFNQLLPARGLVAQLMRGFLVVCGLLFVFSLDLYGVTGYRFFLTWDESMAVWSGWLIGLALLSWLPVRWMTVRGVSQRGWQTEWFAWTSSLLAVG